MLNADELRRLCLDAGAEDAGFASIDAPALAEERPYILRALPRTRALISLVGRTARGNIRNPARSLSNLEFHEAGSRLDETARRVALALESRGVEAVHPAVGFPMEADRWGDRTWVVSHKPVAVAAGMGRMGLHRNVIHPRLGSFVLLATVLVADEVDGYGRELDYEPCVGCQLCVAACPVGAIKTDGGFDFGACYTHNYREFMGGFGQWVESVADAKDGLDYRRRVSDAETVSMWQSLAFGPNYKAAYCVASCPAGTDVIGPYRASKKGFVDEVVRPLRDKEETLYVVAGSDAERHAAERFPRKRLKRVAGVLRARTIPGFLRGARLAFQSGAARGLDAAYHFRFTGAERAEATFVIRDGRLRIEEGLRGTAALRVTADSASWLGFLAKEKSLFWLLLTGRIRLKGDPWRLADFGRCFPS